MSIQLAGVSKASKSPFYQLPDNGAGRPGTDADKPDLSLEAMGGVFHLAEAAVVLAQASLRTF